MKAFNWARGNLVAVAALCLALAGVLMGPLRAQLDAPQTYVGTATLSGGTLTLPVHNVNQPSDVVAVPIRFVPSAANTGPVTALITGGGGGGSIGPYAVVKQTASGLTALIGNEFQPGQIADIMLDGSTNCSGGPCFQCMSCAVTVPAGTVADFTGPVIPPGWLRANGQALSRTSNSVLFNALAIQNLSATTNNGQTSVVVTSTALQVGWYASGANVVCNSRINSIPDSAHVVLSSNATNSGSTSLTFSPYPLGDCATTFNVPNLTGRLTADADGSTNITNVACLPAAGAVGSLGTQCGGQTQTLTLAQLPTGINSSGSASVTGLATPPTGGGSIPVTSGPSTLGTLNVAGAATSNGVPDINSAALSWLNPSSLNVTAGGSATVTSSNTNGTAHPILPPIQNTYKIIKT